MSWRRRWAERAVLIVPYGVLIGLAMDALFKTSPFSSEVNGVLGILLTLVLIAPIRILVRDQRRRSLLH